MSDTAFMAEALIEAQKAADLGEVPVGAVVVRRGEIIARGYNRPISQHDPSAHAEMIAIRAAAKEQGNYRLVDCELYVTLEPCLMCAGVIIHARFSRLIFGAYDYKTGVCGSIANVFNERKLNHHTQVTGGILAAPCGQLLSDFFAQRRLQKKHENQYQHQKPTTDLTE